MNAAVLLAGGRGTRMAGTLEDKVLAPLAGSPVFVHSWRALVASGTVDEIVIVYRDAEQRRALERVQSDFSLTGASVTWAPGGAERRDSVHNGLQALDRKNGCVLIHDAARPLVTPAMIALLATTAERTGAAVLAHRVTDTIKRAAPQNPAAPTPEAPLHGPFALEDIDRESLWAMETPQAFDLARIREGYARAVQDGLTVTDDAAAVALLGHPISLLENPHPNPKLTTPGDLAWITFLLQQNHS